MSEETIFVAALEKTDPAERAAYLDGACARRRRAPPPRRGAAPRPRSRRATCSIRRPATRARAPPPVGRRPRSMADPDRPIAEGPGSRIGPYKLLQQIGEGGMGVVYMAEQDRARPPHASRSRSSSPAWTPRQVIARFEAERQALAMMDHPNIARVLDAGTTDSGRPYFVMELVHGVPITEYCDDNQLTPRERLELFVPVCQAIQHAHQKGIIHRDIKPSNVLVTLYDDKPVPKVIDFGVAKAIEQRLTEQTLFTAVRRRWSARSST